MQITDLNEKTAAYESEVNGLLDYISEIEEEKEALAIDLEEASQNVEDLNSAIDDAKLNAWGTYEDMGDALDAIEPTY